VAAAYSIRHFSLRHNPEYPDGCACRLEMAIGPAQAATVFDGTNYVVLTANWRGLWHFVE
jgi:hypothetical protein